MGVDWNKPLRRKSDKAKVLGWHMIPQEFQFKPRDNSAVRVLLDGFFDPLTYSPTGHYSDIPTQHDLENYEPDIDVWVNVFRKSDGDLYVISTLDEDRNMQHRLTMPFTHSFVGGTKTTVSVE